MNTFKNSYNIQNFSKRLARNKEICNKIVDKYCFIILLRYDIKFCQITFSHCIPVNGKLTIPDISIKRQDILEHWQNLARDFNKLEWEDKLYAPGQTFINISPQTGRVKGPTHTLSEKKMSKVQQETQQQATKLRDL